MLLPSEPKTGYLTGTSIMVANMIGVGVYTSLGYQILGIQSTFALLMLWVVGGLVALCGALTYAELAVVFPRSGGEYNFLSRLYHPALGFLSGWVSITVGFAAPLAFSAMALGEYAQYFTDFTPTTIALALIALVMTVNMIGFAFGTRFQATITLTNICLILSFIIGGLLFANHNHFAITTTSTDWQSVFSGSFAQSLIYVSFAYSGWNSITYIAEDIKNPSKNLPRILSTGALLVMLLYLALNFIFLYSTPQNLFVSKTADGNLIPEVKVAVVAAKNIFHQNGLPFIVFLLCIGFTASANSMMLIGPRVAATVGKDIQLLGFLAKTSKFKTPYIATAIQASIACILVLSSSFDAIITYIGFTLSIFTTLTVVGVFIIRKRKLSQPGLYKTLGYPITPILFIALECWMLYNVLIDRGKLIPSLVTFFIILLGLLLYFTNDYYTKKNKRIIY